GFDDGFQGDDIVANILDVHLHDAGAVGLFGYNGLVRGPGFADLAWRTAAEGVVIVAALAADWGKHGSKDFLCGVTEGLPSDREHNILVAPAHIQDLSGGYQYIA